jgi:hopanoid biosynthesis associated RND transporter like protein HpnN
MTAIVVIAGLPLLYFLRFDFNPLNLRNPKVESIATYLELRSDPNTGASAIQVLAPSLAEASAVEEKLAKLPQTKQVRSLDDFVPPDQDRKLAAIKEIAETLGPAFQPDSALSAPSDQENIAALNKTSGDLTKAAAGKEGPGAAAANRLAGLLARLAKADKPTRDRAEATFIAPLHTALDELKSSLQAQRITIDNLPPDLVSEWVTPDGRARVEVSPAGDPNDNETLRAFARAVLAVAPTATGGPISILESGHTIVRAFLEAGFWALASITLLLWVVLRRFGDVLLTLIPLLLAGVVTMELCVILGMPLNFANIIALPLLLGLGVAFKIYYIMAWRAGQTDLLQSSLTRAVFWSALTTAVAFGSLWLSSHPGTSSMGKLLALSLVTTMCAAVLFQPVLMGKPRSSSDG